MVTTTTTAVVEERPPLIHHLGGAEWEPRYVQAERQARAIRNFWRIAYHYWKYKELLGFCGTVLAGAQHRYTTGRIAIGNELPTPSQYAGATRNTRWQRDPLLPGRRS